MKTDYVLSAPIEERESAFSSIRRIDNFYKQNFRDFESALDKQGIDSEKDYFTLLASDPVIDMMERSRVTTAVNLLKKVKQFNDDYSMPKGGLRGNTLMAIQDSLTEQIFVQDTGMAIYLNLESDNNGALKVVIPTMNGEEQSLKLPFVVKWKEAVCEDYDGDVIATKIGQISLLDQGQKFPRLFKAINQLKFTESPNIGLMAETGYSLRDIQEPSILMKASIIDFSDTLEILSFSANYANKHANQLPNLSFDAS